MSVNPSSPAGESVAPDAIASVRTASTDPPHPAEMNAPETTRASSGFIVPLSILRSDGTTNTVSASASTPVAVEHVLKRPRMPDPITASLTHDPMKLARAEAHEGATEIPLAHDQPPSGPSLSPKAPPSVNATPPTSPYVKIPVRVPQKVPITAPSSLTPRGSPFVPSTCTTSLSSSHPPSFVTTPITTSPLVSATATPRTTPSTPQSSSLRLRWVAMMEKAFLVDCAPHDGERVSDVANRIVASIPGSKAVAADTFLMLKASIADAKNGELRQRILSGQLPVELLVTLNEKDLANPERRKELEEGFQERSKDRNITEMMKAVQTTSTMFPCPSCKVRDCTWMQKQTRSGDEPMTVFCTCNRCGYRWRRY